MHARFLIQHDELRKRREEYEASKKGPDEEFELVAKRKREKKERRRAAEARAAAAAEQCQMEAAQQAQARAKAQATAAAAAKTAAAIRAVREQATRAEAEAAARTQRAVIAAREAAAERAAEEKRRTREEREARVAARARQAAHERAQADLQEYEDLEEALWASMEQLHLEAQNDEEATVMVAQSISDEPDQQTVTAFKTDAFSECVVCMAKPPSHVIIPCGHLCLCMACSVALEQCPICRARVQATMRVFFSAS